MLCFPFFMSMILPHECMRRHVLRNETNVEGVVVKLKQLLQILVAVLKNRYGKKVKRKKHIHHIERRPAVSAAFP